MSDSDTYRMGFDEGYKAGSSAGYNAGFAAGRADQLADMTNQAMDARVNALIEKTMRAHDEFLDNFDGRRAFAEVLYQGVNTLCAHCGQPVQDNETRSVDGRMLFYYCSPQCRDAH